MKLFWNNTGLIIAFINIILVIISVLQLLVFRLSSRIDSFFMRGILYVTIVFTLISANRMAIDCIQCQDISIDIMAFLLCMFIHVAIKNKLTYIKKIH